MKYMANAQSESNQGEDSTLIPGILTAVRILLMESEGLKSGDFPLFRLLVETLADHKYSDILLSAPAS